VLTLFHGTCRKPYAVAVDMRTARRPICNGGSRNFERDENVSAPLSFVANAL